MDLASRSGGDILPFIEYAVQGFVDGLKIQLTYIREQQWDVVWRSYIQETFRRKDRFGDADRRQRDLILDISNTDNFIPLSKITDISSRVAARYALKTPKTLSRDIKELMDMGLIKQTSQGIRAKKESILAFLPARRIQENRK